jgi:hypothetical protein
MTSMEKSNNTIKSTMLLTGQRFGGLRTILAVCFKMAAWQ